MAYTTAQIKQIVADAAARYGIDVSLALAQIGQESSFNPNARSSAGAQGLAQFMPGTWALYGSGSPLDPVAAMDAWGKYMRDLLNAFGGDYRLALAGYHSGQGSAQAALNNCAGNPKTCNYVNTILGKAGSAATPQAPVVAGLSPLALVGLGILALLALR